jgi:hypothetical protein
MVSRESVERQLKRVGFKPHGWGRGEVNELPNILLPDEQIYELVNGIYDGGFALLVATDVRVLLIDQKPLNYLTVEDLRFDMINEMDYSHRLLGARISISSGSKTLKFLSYNQPKLRKLIGHVQHCMAESKKQQADQGEGQVQHLEKINEQLKSYLVAQQEQQQKIQEQLAAAQAGGSGVQSQIQPVDMPKPSPELADYLFAQSLLSQHKQNTGQQGQQDQPAFATVPAPAPQAEPERQPRPDPAASQMDELYAAGMQEIFGKHQYHQPATEVNPITIAYSKLPAALRARKFGPQIKQQPQAAAAVPAPELS